MWSVAHLNDHITSVNGKEKNENKINVMASLKSKVGMKKTLATVWKTFWTMRKKKKRRNDDKQTNLNLM